MKRVGGPKIHEARNITFIFYLTEVTVVGTLFRNIESIALHV